MPSRLSYIAQDRIARLTVAILFNALAVYSHVAAKKKQWRNG